MDNSYQKITQWQTILFALPKTNQIIPRIYNELLKISNKKDIHIRNRNMDFTEEKTKKVTSI